MKKLVEKNLFKSCNDSDLSSSGDESDDNKKIPIENKEEIKKLKNIFSLKKKLKKTTPNKTKKLNKRESSSSNSDDQEKSKPIKPKKPKKTLVKEEDFKRLQKKAKKLGATSLDYSKRKNKKYMVEYNGKKIHFSSINTEDYIIHKDPDRRDKYLTKAMKITTKMVKQLTSFPHIQIIGLSNF